MRVSLTAIAALLASSALAAALSQPPGLDAEGLTAWQQYQKGTSHRAFAIAPGGAWAWQDGLPSPLAARQMALSACRQQSENPCQLFDLDGRERMDAAAWATSLNRRHDGSPPLDGTAIGQRFPNLLLHDAATPDLANLRGKVVVLHFWGSWCPPCAAEIPDFARMAKTLRNDTRIRVLAVPAFEPAADARNWLKSRRIDLPVSAAQTRDGKTLVIRDGQGQQREVSARDLAPVFPSSFVLDQNGVVLMRQLGPVPDWNALIPLLRFAAQPVTAR